MIELSKTPFDADAAAMFRRGFNPGFTHGAQEVLRVVKLYLVLIKLCCFDNGQKMVLEIG